MSGPTGVCVRLSSRSCMPGSCLFPPLLSSLVCTAAETDQLRVMQHPLLQQHNVVLHNNEAMSQCCHRERQDQGISLNLRPLDKAALREARVPYVPETPHTEAGTNQGVSKQLLGVMPTRSRFAWSRGQTCSSVLSARGCLGVCPRLVFHV